jgi:hypothetical protein
MTAARVGAAVGMPVEMWWPPRTWPGSGEGSGQGQQRGRRDGAGPVIGDPRPRRRRAARGARLGTTHHAARSARIPQHACGAGPYRLLRQLVSSSQGRRKASPAAPSLARSAAFRPIETARSGARPANSWLTPGCWQRSRVAKGVCSPESAGRVAAGYLATSKRRKGHARVRTTGARWAYVPCLTIPFASSLTSDCRSAEPRR